MTNLDPRGLEAAAKALRDSGHRGGLGGSGLDARTAVAAYLAAAAVPPDGENPLRVDVRPADDRYFVWVCPTHGIISEDELAEGVDWQNPNPDGDIYTDEFFCQRQHADDEDHRVQTFDLAPVLAAGRAAATPPSNYDEAVKRGTPWGRAAATPDPRCGNCGHVSFHAAAATPDPRNGCRAPHCFSEYGTPCGNCPVAELREAAGRLLVAFAAEEDEHGFPFSFELRDAHRALVAAADRDKPEGGLFGPDTGTYARRGNDPLFADREENTDA